MLARRRRHLLELMLDIKNSFQAELVEGMYDAGDREGYDLVLSTLPRSPSEPRAIETLVDFRCDAMILLGPHSSAASWRRVSDLPIVVVAPVTRGVDVVRSADDSGVSQGVDHLVELGHRLICYSAPRSAPWPGPGVGDTGQP